MSRLRARRGAALVMATLAITGVMVMIAATTDISRLMAVKNELQTAVDAAALAVTDRLADTPPTASLVASAIARANAVTGNTTITVDSVRLGTWDPEAGKFLPIADPWAADAAQVVASTSARFMFGRLLGGDGARVRVRAIAWQAPVEETWCAKPWFLFSEDVLALIGKEGGRWEEISHEDVRKLRDTTKGKKWAELQESGKGGVKGHAVSLPAFEDGGTGSNSGAQYRQSISECHQLRVGWTVAPISGEKVGPTVQGAADLCKPLADDICYNGKGGIGIPVAIPVFDLTEVEGKSRFVVKGIVGFMLTGVIEKGNDAGNVSGFLIGLQGTGGRAAGPSGVSRPMLVR